MERWSGPVEGWLREVRALTMDVYGTLLDLDGSLRGPLEELVRGRTPGPPPDVLSLLAQWRAALTSAFEEDALLGQERTPFRELVRRALMTVLRRHGVPVSPEEAGRLAARWDDLEPFPDVGHALPRLHGRFRLALLSNGDPDMLEAAARALGTPLDAILSTAGVGTYKPAPQPYRMASEALGGPPEAVLHVAAHAWDIKGARAYGLRTCWVNRRGEPYEETPLRPELEVRDLRELADELLRAAEAA